MSHHAQVSWLIGAGIAAASYLFRRSLWAIVRGWFR
jgi:hypothetical protein